MAENSNSSAGFFFGTLIGAGAVFLLGTKKGKKLLKVLTEEGIEGVAEIAQLIDGNMEEADVRRLKRNLKPKAIQKHAIEKTKEIAGQIKKSDTVRDITDKLEEIKDSKQVQKIADKIDDVQNSKFVTKKLEPIMEDVKTEGEAIGDQVKKSAKRLFKGIPKKLRK